jgi:hypothetical protein
VNVWAHIFSSFGHTAYDDAVNFGHKEPAKVIEAYLRKHALPF